MRYVDALALAAKSCDGQHLCLKSCLFALCSVNNTTCIEHYCNYVDQLGALVSNLQGFYSTACISSSITLLVTQHVCKTPLDHKHHICHSILATIYPIVRVSSECHPASYTMSITEQPKRLRFCLMLEDTSALAREWQDLKTNYVMPLLQGIARSYKQRAECALILYRTRTGCNSQDIVQHIAWTSDFARLATYIDGLQPSGGGQMEVAFAEGLAEALYLFSRPSRYWVVCAWLLCMVHTNHGICTRCYTPPPPWNTYFAPQAGSPRIAQQALVFCWCQHCPSATSTMADSCGMQIHTGMWGRICGGIYTHSCPA